MAFNQTLITDINTAVEGVSGANGPATPSASGGDAPPAADTWSGYSFDDTSATAELLLHPSVSGGYGGGGEPGADGANGIGSSTVYGDGSILNSWTAGQNGGGGGNGGDGGDGDFTFGNDAIGLAAAPNGSEFSISASADGGSATSGYNGGTGGSAGDNAYHEGGSPPTTEQDDGGQPGNGGVGGEGGVGGAANAVVSSLTAYTTTGGYITLKATGGYGGNGGNGGAGALQGGAPSAGGDGGAGEAGGNAAASVADSTLDDASVIDISLLAAGGTGGAGGNGAPGGPEYTNDGTGPTTNDYTYDYGANGTGGAGGAAGNATASLTGNVILAPAVDLSLEAVTPVASSGGIGGEVSAAPPGITSVTSDGNVTTWEVPAYGANGAAGAPGGSQIVITGNSIALSGAGSSLFLDLLDGTGSSASPAAAVLSGVSGGNLVFSGNTITGTGSSELNLQVSGGGVVVNTADDTIGIGGSPGNTLIGFSTFRLDNNDTFVAGSGTYTVTVNADPDTVVVSPQSGELTLQGVTEGNLVVDFSGFGGALDSVGEVTADITQADGTTTIDVPGGPLIILETTAWTPSAGDLSFATACYAAGTRIATPRGEVAVEDLRAGDTVFTASGRVRPVRWLGHRDVDCRRHAQPAQVWPIRVRAHAFGAGQPHRDLWLSPDHAVFTGGVLIPVRHLANATTVRQVPVDTVGYWHVELDRHDLLLAEGMAAESYLDTGNRGAFANGGGATLLHADFSLGVWDAEACAALVTGGAALVAARRRLLGRAAALGYVATDEPGLRLAVDGGVFLPEISGRSHRFCLPEGGGVLRLLSRAACPAEALEDADDRRRLGVAVARIVADGVTIDLGDSRLGGGWHADEGDWRWTDGDAALVLPGVRQLDVEVAMTARSWIEPETGERRAA